MVKITEELVRKKSEHNERLIGTLEELSLHQENIERIEHIHNWCRDLKILLLQSNLIFKIENLFKLKKLEYLNLALNSIERIENLEPLESLNKLDLTLNFIGDLTSVESLRGNYNLRELILMGNPCADFPNYRDYVIVALPQINKLDSEEVKLSDRLLARKDFEQNRAGIVQAQARYSIERDEQKIRYAEHKHEMEMKMASIEDEDERNKLFWDTKTENCPEVRKEIHEQQEKVRKLKSSEGEKPVKKTPKLFAPCGRPYSLNQPKLPFLLKDEPGEYILQLKVYKFLDTSFLKVDIQPKYIRVTVKGKIFQLGLSDEVTAVGSVVQRSQITGELLIKAPKLNYDHRLERPRSDEKPPKNKQKEISKGLENTGEMVTFLTESNSMIEFKEAVDYRNIVSQPKETKDVKKDLPPIDESEVPDLE